MNWIDEENFGPALRTFVNSRSTWYQTKKEFLTFLGDGGCIKELEISYYAKSELRNWLLASTLDQMRQENQLLKKKVLYLEMRVPLVPPPPPVYDEERFNAFKEELLTLLGKHHVDIYGNYDGEIMVVNCDESPSLNLLENEIDKAAD